MGQGGYITLVNGTKYDWIKTKQHYTGMNTWSFPDTIAAKSSAKVYVEWSSNPPHDAGEVVYELAGTLRTFGVLAQNQSGFDLLAHFHTLTVPKQPQGSQRSLGWKHDGYVNFILAGEVGNLYTSPLPEQSWMHENLALLGDRPLSQICIPGSHDAGMSVWASGTSGSTKANTLTQTLSIWEQLNCGARYFDIRPVISGGHFLTGHYSLVADWWQGGNGQSIDQIIAEVNAYTETHPELIILNLSHDLHTDVGAQSYRPFNQDEWERLFFKLSRLNHLVTLTDLQAAKIPMLKLRELLPQNQAAVIVRVDASGGSPDRGKYANKGFFSDAQFLIYDRYAEKNDVDEMAKDQLAKMHENSRFLSDYFLLSWTLTQSGSDAVGLGWSILDLANYANPELYIRLLPHCSLLSHPNILYIDNVNSSDIAALAMAVNWGMEMAANWAIV